MPTWWIRLVGALALAFAGCDGDDEGEEPEPMEQDLAPEDEANEGKTEEAEYDPTQFCLDNGSVPNAPNVGPAALGDTVLGTSGRADGFGNETWGAEYGAELSLQGVAGGPHGVETLIRGELVGSATVFDVSQDVVRIVLDGVSTGDGMTGFEATLTILDRYSFPLLDYEGNFSDEQHFSAPLFTATTGVPLVPGLAPVEVSATATGQLGYLVSGQILPKGIAVLVRPEAAVLISAQANVGAEGIAAARVEGQVELLRMSVPIQAALTFDEQGGIEFSWDVRVDMDADWLAGDMELVASAFGADRYRKSIAEWEGWHLSTTHLTNGAGAIFPGAPGACDPSELQRGDAPWDALTWAGDTGTADRGTERVVALGLQADAPDRDPLATLDALHVELAAATGRERRVAAYALGNALAGVRAFEPEASAAVLDELVGAYERATNTDEQVLLLRTIGNAGATSTLPLLRDTLDDEAAETKVKLAAVRALRHVIDHEADATLRAVMLDEDADVKVRAEAVRTAGARRTTQSDRAVAELAMQPIDDWVQIAAVHALGRAVTRSEEAAEALRFLEAHAGQKTVRDVARNYLYRLDAVVSTEE